LMDCDTTGIVPDFAIVKFKKLAGGGYFKIVNQAVTEALRNLGYTESQRADILRYVLGTMSLENTSAINRAFLKAKGLTDAELDKIEKTLPGTFELSSAFSRYTLGDGLLNRVGVPRAEFEKPTFNFMTWLGMSGAQIAEAGEKICGTMTIEGAPHLKDEHLAVFDCANKCGAKGKRFIEPRGHIRMMAAAQPFLSGAISKTVNVPNETTVAEIESIYWEGWKLGLKAVALYRDGCKLSQPLTTKSSDSANSASTTSAPGATTMVVVNAPDQVGNSAAVAMPAPMMTFAPSRRKLPAKRKGFTQEAAVAGHKVYIRTGEYQDGMLGELFIDMHKEGAAYRSMMNCFAIAVSLGLQYGVPLSEFVDKFTFTRFEPSGPVSGHPNVKMATSIVDYIFRVLGLEYLGRTDFVQVKPVVAPVDLTTEKGAVTEVYPQNVAQALATGGAVAGIDRQLELGLQQALGSGSSSEKLSSENLASAAKLVAAAIQQATAAGAGAAAAGISSASVNHLASMMGDAPACDGCGHTTVRNGACYKCLNCGNSMGCS
ncbi:MAG: vitamin B12-dependent ribonucleotide reductase, partial [Bdellovibrionota bacterium]